MTAGSLELAAVRPVRVPAVGLAVPLPTTIPAPPSLMHKQRIRRNLFGSAEPGEAEALRRQEEQTKLEYCKARYNVDLTKLSRQVFESPSPAKKLNLNITNTNSTNTPTSVGISLIELEMNAYQERLQAKLSLAAVEEDEKCNLNIENMQANAETTPQPPKKKINSHVGNSNSSPTEPTVKLTSSIKSNSSKQSKSDQLLEISSNCCRSSSTDGNSNNSNSKSTTINLGNNNHQQRSDCNGCVKTHVRQRLITECYTVRKTPQIRHGKQQLETKSLVENPKILHKIWQESDTMIHDPEST